MDHAPRIALLGFLPWIDPARRIEVRENPASVAAARAAAVLVGQGVSALFVPVAVSGEGIVRALQTVRAFDAGIVVSLGQTGTEPRVERVGRVPGAWAPAMPEELGPWPLAPDAEALAAELNMHRREGAGTQPVRASDDAGGYFCDHLCVELVRESRRRPLAARFLHVTAIDGCDPPTREERLAEYTAQALALVDWLRGPRLA